MPSSYTSAQKSAIAQFVSFTQVKDGVAAKTLKSNGWNVEQAVDSYFSSTPNATNPLIENTTRNLNTLFDNYTSSDDRNSMDLDHCATYLADIGVGIEEPVVLTLLSELRAPTIGELSRTGFVEGWARKSADDITKQTAYVRSIRPMLQTVTDVYKATYKASFALIRPSGSKVLPLDQAIGCWETLFRSPGVAWSTPTTPWLEWWKEFLTTKWDKAVNKDLWDQTLFFMIKTQQDENMGWWSEEGSWPGVIDEFVAFGRAKRSEASNGAMDEG